VHTKHSKQKAVKPSRQTLPEIRKQQYSTNETKDDFCLPLLCVCDCEKGKEGEFKGTNCEKYLEPKRDQDKSQWQFQMGKYMF